MVRDSLTRVAHHPSELQNKDDVFCATLTSYRSEDTVLPQRHLAL